MWVSLSSWIKKNMCVCLCVCRESQCVFLDILKQCVSCIHLQSDGMGGGCSSLLIINHCHLRRQYQETWHRMLWSQEALPVVCVGVSVAMLIKFFFGGQFYWNVGTKETHTVKETEWQGQCDRVHMTLEKFELLPQVDYDRIFPLEVQLNYLHNGIVRISRPFKHLSSTMDGQCLCECVVSLRMPVTSLRCTTTIVFKTIETLYTAIGTIVKS